MKGSAAPEQMQVAKKEGQKTLIEIIEDSRSGIPAKSEIESKVSLHIINLINSFLIGEEGILEKEKEG